ncbi:MAG: DNA topoisomerase [Proteobacteria bacterium]|nr:DNA topoisomerase [Pseudomonadota bacterium]
MAKALVITEKPSVAQDIATALGGFEEHDGYFESDELVVTFAVGHLFELMEPEEVDPKYKAWTLEVLPILPADGALRVKPKKGHSERIRTIKRLLFRDDVDRVINACDAGREGELIFREIVQYLESDKPIERLWLQSMTKNAILRGFESLRPGEELEGLAAAAECRALSDWLIGMNATRAITKRFASRKERTAWSAGRVQTPTLALLVDKEFEVLAHVPRAYWRVEGTFAHAGQTYTGAWFDPDFDAGDDEDAKDDRIFDEERARAIVAAVNGEAATASEQRKPSRESAPPLFDLTSLQREANRRFSWSARRTLNAAQRCYERHKALTYPRTSSRCLPSDYRETVAEVLHSYAGAADHGEGFDEYARAAANLESAGLQNEPRIFDDGGVSDHFAIIPTGSLPTEPLTGDDKRLFDLVVRRFLGAFHPPAVWERVERVTEAGGQRFRTRARSLQEPGWRAVLAAGADEEAAETLAPLAEASGVAVRTEQALAIAEQTRPAARISEARLLSLMENAGQQIDDEDLAAVLHEKGIGTPATRAEIIENLIRKGYVLRVGKALRPTVKGIRLIDSLRRINIDRLASPALTGELEQHLLEVERGERTAKEFLDEVKRYAVEVVERAKTFGYEELYADAEDLGPCPSCGGSVKEMAWFYRCPETGKPREEDCPMRFWKDTSGRYLNSGAVRALLRDGVTPTLDGFTARNGRTYKGHIEIDRESWKLVVRSEGWNEESASDIPEYEVNTDPVATCPICCEHDVVESPTEFSCEDRLKEKEPEEGEKKPKKCPFVMPRTVCKREITRDELQYYIENKRTELLTDFTSRFGRPFSATLVLKENGRHGFEFPPRAAGAGGRGKKKTGKTGKGGRKKKAAGAKTAAPKKAAAARSSKKAGRKKAATRKRATKKKADA